jgi:hypothetical protein
MKHPASFPSRLLPILLLLLAGCRTGASLPEPSPGLNPFVKMARGSVCADKWNRLYLIDEKLVFWDRQGECADNSYAQTLYGKSPDEILCLQHDSIAGPRKECRDAKYAQLFETLIAHLGEPNLGLGPGHTARRLPL